MFLHVIWYLFLMNLNALCVTNIGPLLESPPISIAIYTGDQYTGTMILNSGLLFTGTHVAHLVSSQVSIGYRKKTTVK